MSVCWCLSFKFEVLHPLVATFLGQSKQTFCRIGERSTLKVRAIKLASKGSWQPRENEQIEQLILRCLG